MHSVPGVHRVFIQVGSSTTRVPAPHKAIHPPSPGPMPSWCGAMGPGVAERRARPQDGAARPLGAGSAMGGLPTGEMAPIPSRHEDPERGYRSPGKPGQDTRDRASPKTSASPFGAYLPVVLSSPSSVPGHELAASPNETSRPLRRLRQPDSARRMAANLGGACDEAVSAVEPEVGRATTKMSAVTRPPSSTKNACNHRRQREERRRTAVVTTRRECGRLLGARAHLILSTI